MGCVNLYGIKTSSRHICLRVGNAVKIYFITNQKLCYGSCDDQAPLPDFPHRRTGQQMGQRNRENSVLTRTARILICILFPQLHPDVIRKQTILTFADFYQIVRLLLESYMQCIFRERKNVHCCCFSLRTVPVVSLRKLRNLM